MNGEQLGVRLTAIEDQLKELSTNVNRIQRAILGDMEGKPGVLTRLNTVEQTIAETTTKVDTNTSRLDEYDDLKNRVIGMAIGLSLGSASIGATIGAIISRLIG